MINRQETATAAKKLLNPLTDCTCDTSDECYAMLHNSNEPVDIFNNDTHLKNAVIALGDWHVYIRPTASGWAGWTLVQGCLTEPNLRYEEAVGASIIAVIKSKE